MKKYTNRFSTQRWDNFTADVNVQEDDLLLADLHTMPDDTGLTITPLNHIVDAEEAVEEEDAIDRLLANSGFGAAHNAPAHAANPDDRFVAIDAAISPATMAVDQPVTGSAMDWQAQVDVVAALTDTHHQTDPTPTPSSDDFKVDAFISDYLAQRQPEQRYDHAPEPGVADGTANDETALSATTEVIVSPTPKPDDGGSIVTDTLNNDEAWASPPSTAIPKHALQIGDNTEVLQQLKANQVHLETQLAQLQKTSASATRLNYALLAFAIAILIANAALFTLMADLKTDATKLTAWVEMLKAGMEAAQQEMAAGH
ncbi:MAG: hypothetical protein Q7U57_08695 [Methylovulum sp.]|nr:hypothetical protein [Methylovulum sp.]